MKWMRIEIPNLCVRTKSKNGKNSFVVYVVYRCTYRYGWIWKPFTKLDLRDRKRFIKPRCKAELSEFAEKLEEQTITARPKFGGIIFKL